MTGANILERARQLARSIVAGHQVDDPTEWATLAGQNLRAQMLADAERERERADAIAQARTDLADAVERERVAGLVLVQVSNLNLVIRQREMERGANAGHARGMTDRQMLVEQQSDDLARFDGGARYDAAQVDRDRARRDIADARQTLLSLGIAP
jgi:hypothetical protein